MRQIASAASLPAIPIIVRADFICCSASASDTKRDTRENARHCNCSNYCVEGKPAMPGPRKVRVFRDRKKSPNWYVEWRDAEGSRHCESCGPTRKDAEDRASRLRTQLQATRLAPLNGSLVEESDPTSPNSESVSTPSHGLVAQVIRLNASLQLGREYVPITVTIDLTPELLQALQRTLSLAKVI
jgi:hypothetical protein